MSAFAHLDERRRAAVRGSALNGIDFVEVVDSDAASPAERQRILRVHFLKSPAPPDIAAANILISGGDRITGIVAGTPKFDGDVLVVPLDKFGDFSTYRLQLVAAADSRFDAAKLDSRSSSAEFSFKVECPSDFDVSSTPPAAFQSLDTPDIDYLARDYSSFRQLMLDRISLLAPQWQERNPADIGMALVEFLAHAGDLLSYQQDAVATEAYLATSRRRISVRRHARLVDYLMDEGSNARAFVHVETSADIVLSKGTQMLSFVEGQRPVLGKGSPELLNALAKGPEIFETMHDASLFAAHGRISFYTWGDAGFTLPKGEVTATLRGHFSAMKPGDVLVFEEIASPLTGKAEEADHTRRCAVRLTNVTAGSDPLGGMFDQPANANPVDVTQIEWAQEDRLPFDLSVTASLTSGDNTVSLRDLTIGRGNIVLVDHGRSLDGEVVGPVPAIGRFAPRLKSGPLVQARAYDPANPSPASVTLRPSSDPSAPALHLQSGEGTGLVRWQAQRDLLNSLPDTKDFVVETESDGSAFLRFGDDTNGQRPAPGTLFTASYRTSDPLRGNVGADRISHVVSADPAILHLRNPLPARGGMAPESLEHVRQSAPFAFRRLQRAVTPQDYQAIAERHGKIQRAAATPRWTGSWSTMFVTIDREQGQEVDDDFRRELRGFVEPFRMAGHDLEIDGPRFVSLEIEMRVEVQRDHFRRQVKAALLDVFSNRQLSDGRTGLFHPDNFTFGQPVYLSPLYAAAQAVDGVASSRINLFRRQGQTETRSLGLRRLEMNRLEIARLDNDPDFPERGVFRVVMGGGK